jgi:hypothetical protein
MPRLILALMCALLHGFLAGAAEPVSFWVWHRSSPLHPDEITSLERMGITTLFWNVGELELRGGDWKWLAPPMDPAGRAGSLRCVPVVRLSAARGHPIAPEDLGRIPTALRGLPKTGNALQLDFDCPDRLLAHYAAALSELRRDIPDLGITALAHWSALPAFAALGRSVSEITPMFYDLQADPTGVSPETPPPPLLDPAQVERALKGWSRCSAPWRAGLPTFSRLTVFDRGGSPRGQIPNWSWDDFCFHRALRATGPTRLGVTLFRAETETRVSRTAIHAGEFVASRFTARDALRRAMDAARGAGAAGITFFRLPDRTDPAGSSLSDLAHAEADATPHLTLRWDHGDQLVLTNDSVFDLVPRLAGAKGDRDRGYALELDAPGTLFREALPGQFWRVTAHVDPDGPKPAPAPVQLATRLTFWFSHLRAGDTLRTELVQTAPGMDRAPLRYRILHCNDSTQWTPLNPP